MKNLIKKYFRYKYICLLQEGLIRYIQLQQECLNNMEATRDSVFKPCGAGIGFDIHTEERFEKDKHSKVKYFHEQYVINCEKANLINEIIDIVKNN